MSLDKYIPIVEEKAEAEQQQGPAVPTKMAAPSPCEAAEPYVLMVLGDSMEPEFNEGEVIVIEPEGHAHDGSYVVALHDGEYIFRQLRIRDGRHFIVALKEGYPEQELEGIKSVKGVITQKSVPGNRKARKFYT